MSWRSLLRPLTRLWRGLVAPRIVYGLRSGDGTWRPHSRISTHACIEHARTLRLGDHVFIGHFSVLDASGGLEIGDGCQITNHVSVLTHSTHRALRLGREACWGDPTPPGLVRAPTRLGEWTFVGPHSVIAPGTRIGRGVLVKAYSHVRGEVPDFAVVEGRPARVVGDTRALDGDWLAAQGAAVGDDVRRAWAAWAAPAGQAPAAAAADGPAR